MRNVRTGALAPIVGVTVLRRRWRRRRRRRQWWFTRRQHIRVMRLGMEMHGRLQAGWMADALDDRAAGRGQEFGDHR